MLEDLFNWSAQVLIVDITEYYFAEISAKGLR